MMTCGDAANVQKFINLGTSTGMVQATSNYYTIHIPDMPFKVYTAIHDDIFFISSDQSFMSRLGTGYTGAAKLSKDQFKALKKNASYGYMDMHKLFDFIEMMDDTGMAALGTEPGRKLLKSVNVVGSKEITTSSSSTFSLNFVDADTNALIQLMLFANDMMGMFMSGDQS